MTEPSEWEPGDPLYSRAKSPSWAGYLFGFREDHSEAECREDGCAMPDAASWPEPRYTHRLPKDCPVERFIREYHAAQEDEAA